MLGAMMLSETALAAASEMLRAADFYSHKNGAIFQAAVDLYGTGVPVDAISLTDSLEARGELGRVDGRARVHELAAIGTVTPHGAQHHAAIVREHARLRGLIAISQETARAAWERQGTAAELHDKAEQALFRLATDQHHDGLAALSGDLRDAFEQIASLYESGSDITGLASGLRDLDRITLGFQPQDLIVLGARPSIGKSALALCMAANIVRAGPPVALFTLEMSRRQIIQRLLSLEANVELQKLRNGRLSGEDWPRLAAAADRLAKAPLYVDDTGSISLMEIRAKARRLKHHVPELALIVVDYLGLIGDVAGARAEHLTTETGRAASAMKTLAKDLDLPVLLLCQLSRKVEERHDKRPILSDLRQSGEIEQHADLVMFLYRDDYYNSESDAQGIAELNLSKHRNGPTDTVKLAWSKTRARFGDLA